MHTKSNLQHLRQHINSRSIEWCGVEQLRCWRGFDTTSKRRKQMDLKDALALGLPHIRTQRAFMQNNLKHEKDENQQRELSAKISEYIEAEKLYMNYIKSLTSGELREPLSEV